MTPEKVVFSVPNALGIPPSVAFPPPNSLTAPGSTSGFSMNGETTTLVPSIAACSAVHVANVGAPATELD